MKRKKMVSQVRDGNYVLQKLYGRKKGEKLSQKLKTIGVF